MLFLGTGKRVTEAEREAHHKDVSVHFNKKTWVDNEFATKWIQIFKDYPGARQAKLRRNAIICLQVGYCRGERRRVGVDSMKDVDSYMHTPCL